MCHLNKIIFRSAGTSDSLCISTLYCRSVMKMFHKLSNGCNFNQKVMLDRDLAEMYGVQTKVLNQTVKRNIEKFPEDFMFQLTSEETNNWRSQFVTSNSIKMGLRRNPYAFTELGVAMLSSILSSKLAIQVNINIMRAFVAVRQIIALPPTDKLAELQPLRASAERCYILSQ